MYWFSKGYFFVYIMSGFSLKSSKIRCNIRWFLLLHPKWNLLPCSFPPFSFLQIHYILFQDCGPDEADDKTYSKCSCHVRFLLSHFLFTISITDWDQVWFHQQMHQSPLMPCFFPPFFLFIFTFLSCPLDNLHSTVTKNRVKWFTQIRQ